MISFSRYRHYCPGCKKLLVWRKVFCVTCIESHSEWSKIQLNVDQKWLKGRPLRGSPELRARISTMLKDKWICLECGRGMESSTEIHRCYYRGHIGKKAHCRFCRTRMRTTKFPVINRDADYVRLVICIGCLPGKKISVNMAQ